MHLTGYMNETARVNTPTYELTLCLRCQLWASVHGEYLCH